MRINEIIKERRLAKGFTQEQIANYLGVTAPAVNKMGERNVVSRHSLASGACQAS